MLNTEPKNSSIARVIILFLLFIGCTIVTGTGWAVYGESVSERKEWNQAECNIATVAVNPPTVCSQGVCSAVVIYGSASVKGTIVSYVFAKDCRAEDTKCLTEYFVGQILPCWFNGDNFWRFDEPSSYNKAFFGITIACTVYSGLFVLYCFIKKCLCNKELDLEYC